MGTNHLKFVSILGAMDEVKTTLLMQSEFKKREELEPILRQIEDMQIRNFYYETLKHLITFKAMEGSIQILGFSKEVSCN